LSPRTFSRSRAALTLGFGALLALMIAVTLVGLFHLHRVHQQMEDIVYAQNYRAGLATTLLSAGRSRARLLGQLAPGAVVGQAGASAQFRALIGQYAAAVDALESTPGTLPPENAALATVRTHWSEAEGLAEAMLLSMLRKEPQAQSEDLALRARDAYDAYETSVHELLVAYRSGALATMRSASGGMQQALLWVTVIGVVVLVAGALVAFEVIRRTSQVELALAREKERAEVTLHSICDGVITTDADGNVDTLNPVAERHTGWALQEARGQPLAAVYRVMDETSGEPLPLDRPSAGDGVVPAVRLLDRAGQAYSIRESHAPILDADGKPYKLIKYVLDVTKQKELEIELQSTLMEKQAQEEELRQNMEGISAINDEMGHVQMELRSVLEGIGRTTAVIEFDLKGNIQHANDNFLNAMGYELNEIADKHHRIFMDEADAAGAEYAEMWQQLNEGKPLTGVFRRRHKNGSRIWIMGSYNPIFDRNGKPYKLVKYVMDVTKAKEQEIELQQALMEKQAQEEELRQNMEEISAINDEMHDKNIVIEDLNRDLKANNLQLAIAKEKLEVRMNDVQLEIKESIRYAQRIQRALIPAPERLNQDIPANFHAGVLFIPRDIVSGDFYWAGPVSDGRIMLAVGDGTGHGVPGSFMSLLGVTTLQKHLEKGLTDPAEILFAMNKDLQALLAQQHGEVLDSIEMILISLNPDGSDLRYASAMRPLYLVENEKLTELEFSRHSVGGRPVQGETINFRTFELNINLGACLYLMSDGLQDQFGGFGDKAKKWSRSAMKDAITRLTSEVPLRKRAAALARLHTDWRGYFIDQTDDICCLMLELETVKAE